MYKNSEGQLCYSPSDLVTYLQCPFSSWMARYDLEHPGELTKDPKDEALELLKEKGIAFEEEFLVDLQKEGRQVVVLPETGDRALAAAGTKKAVEEKAEVIYQAYLKKDAFAGFSDFLVCYEGHYEVWDTKLSKKVKPYFLIQLCAYAEMLEVITGELAPRICVVLGNRERRHFETKNFYDYYLYLKNDFLEFQENFNKDDRPTPPLNRKTMGPWNQLAAKWFEEKDHLSRVANLSVPRIRRLEKAGLNTMTALAQTEDKRVPLRLKKQAQLQLESKDKDRPLFEVFPHEEKNTGLHLLPPTSPGDVYFDIEGYPLTDGGLEYLFGVIVTDNEEPEFHDWWAHSREQEKQSFKDFVAWLMKRREAFPYFHVYHYGAYEVSALRRLMGQYAVCEAQVDQLLREERFVDLYAIVRQGLVVGEPKYSLKNIEKIYLKEQRQEDVTAALESVSAYHQWLEADRSVEGETWESSEILKNIRDYNEQDCVSTFECTTWLRGLQEQAGLDWRGNREQEPAAVEESGTEENEREVLAQKLGDQESDPVARFLSLSLDFHRREEKPTFWKMFARHTKTEEELREDPDCLVGLTRTASEPVEFKSGKLFEYRYNRHNDSPIRKNSRVLVAHDLNLSTQVVDMNPRTSTLQLKFGDHVEHVPSKLSLIPYEHVPSFPLQNALLRFATQMSEGETPSKAIRDFLLRQRPDFQGDTGEDFPQTPKEILQVVEAMNHTTLCIQGPPGTGKTHLASRLIAELMRQGKKVGVTSNSHAAINHLMVQTLKQCTRRSITAGAAKIQGSHGEGELFQFEQVRRFKNMSHCAPAVGSLFHLVGGTAWPFCHEAASEVFDYLFVDEAGQVSVANLIAMSLSTKNIVLMGDQMQLSQPLQGTHPGESGQSTLQYLLQDHATIPPEAGVFLPTTWRMHPDICSFVSTNFYDGRLIADESTKEYKIPFKGSGHHRVSKEAGLFFAPVTHEGNTRSSVEEIEEIKLLLKDLFGRGFNWDEILIVAPYNLQVQLLQEALGPHARVGTVDKFQGQEAMVVILSMCASSLEYAPRGMEFLLNRNRFNVALSRARALAIVVASPGILDAKPSTADQLALLNMYCQFLKKA